VERLRQRDHFKTDILEEQPAFRCFSHTRFIARKRTNWGRLDEQVVRSPFTVLGLPSTGSGPDRTFFGSMAMTFVDASRCALTMDSGRGDALPKMPIRS
jgi:hypothetical protein